MTAAYEIVDTFGLHIRWHQAESLNRVDAKLGTGRATPTAQLGNRRAEARLKLHGAHGDETDASL